MRLFLFAFLSLSSSIIYAQEVMYLSGNGAGPELYIEDGEKGYIYVEGGILVEGATPDIILNGALWVDNHNTLGAGNIINNSAGILSFDTDKTSTPTLTGILPTLKGATSSGLSNTQGAIVHLCGDNQVLGGNQASAIRFYHLSLEGNGRTQKQILGTNAGTNQYTIEVGESSGALGNTGVLYLNNEYFLTEENRLWIKNSSPSAIERTPQGSTPNTGSGMASGGQNVSTQMGMVSSTGQGRLSWNTVSGNTYVFPLGTQDSTLYRPLEILTTSGTPVTYDARMEGTNPNPTSFGNVAPVSTNNDFYHIINANAATGDEFRLYLFPQIDFLGQGSCDENSLLSNIALAQSEVTVANWGAQQGSVGTSTGNLTFVESINYPSANFGACASGLRDNYSAWSGFLGVSLPTENYALATKPIACLSNTDCLPFPIELLSFQGEVEGYKNRLWWITSREQNTDYFTLFRSADGQSFEAISNNIAAAGNSNTPLEYQWIDEQPLRGKNYYRLQSVDIDGTSQYSGIVELYQDVQSFFFLYPNPSEGELNLQLDNLKGDFTFNINNILGQSVIKYTFQSDGNFLEKVSVNSLSPAIYTYTLSKGSHVFFRGKLEISK